MKESITCLMCYGDMKDHDKSVKLNNVLQELEELCLTRGMVTSHVLVTLYLNVSQF